jgi:late competence protein required for DNA uptake (superfamily II DNA/RNA helicase)
MLIEQIYSTDEDLRCERCNATHGTFISFSCDHKFCVLCLSFMYVKHRKFDPNEGTVKCLICQKITNLHPSHL